MATIFDLLARATRVEHCLLFAEKYFAHKPKKSGQKPKETLGQHMELVLMYFGRLCEAHGLDSKIDGLLAELPLPTDAARDFWKKLFVEAIAFHDFGKVNEHYQRKKMDNDLHFPKALPVPIFPAHGHSEFGAFIFIAHFFDEINASPFEKSEKEWAFMGTMLFANSIMLHHSGRMNVPPIEKLEKAKVFQQMDSIQRFLDCYQFAAPRIAKGYFSRIETYKQAFSEKEIPPFPLWALLRLHFSLLTAADYIATGEYMNGLEIKDFNLIDATLRAKIIEKARTSETYNADAFAFAADSNFEFQHPTEPSGKNLNVLRTEMAVEVLLAVQAEPKSPFYYLEAPTGGGKTNLSMLAVAELLRLDASLDKVFYVFPFTTLITQTHAVIKKTLGLTDDEVALMHSKAGFQQKKGVKSSDSEAETEEDVDYGDEKKDFMENQFGLYPVCLLTHIRFFDFLKSNAKEAIYGMHRLANSIVVIDELQSYSPSEWDRMLWHIDHYGRFFNMRFLLMSATLPKIDELEIDLKNQVHFVPLLPDSKRYFQNRNFAGRVVFDFELLEKAEDSAKMREIELPELAEAVFSKSKKYAAEHGSGSVHTIIEFIFKKAASDFQALVEQIEVASGERFFDEIFVLSGTILEPRRREVIHFLKKKENREKRVLLISTQVVEAGVDIDMDLGFKNISLLDSDEQLAGRVNRNVNKSGCRVFLFKHNEASVIYGKDFRFKVMREELPMAEQKEILREKDFQKLYKLVFARLDDRNREGKLIGLEKDFPKYREAAESLDSRKVNELFKLIDSDNFSIFVPLELPLFVEGKDGPDAIFSDGEKAFLKKHGALRDGDETVDGRAVWQLFRALKGEAKDHSRFIERNVEDKRIQGILGKFTFSLFKNEKMIAELKPFCGEDEKSFEDILYLRKWQGVYSLENGLSTQKLNDSEFKIL